MPLKLLVPLIGFVAVTSLLRAGEPIRVHPENPNYFLWRGQPTVLVSATEHYGSVINPAFDYARYLETIAADNLNATMVMSGAFIEGGLGQDSLQPPKGEALIPWARSEVPGYIYGGNKFDLTRFNEDYFKRLKAFVSEAGNRGVVVWYVFFTPYFDDHKWKASPWHPANYAHGPAAAANGDFFTLERGGEFIAVQEALVRRVVEELRDADNVIYEPIYDGQAKHAEPRWLDHITGVIAGAQQDHPHRKLISRNFGNLTQKLAAAPEHVSVLAWKMSDVFAAENNRHLSRPVAHTETGFIPTNDAFSRMRAWDFLFAGGAAFIHMDWTLQTPDPTGRRAHPKGMFGGGPVQRRELGALNRFFHHLNIPRLRPVPGFITNTLPTQVSARTLAETDRHYYTYLRQDTPSGRTSVRWTGRLTPRFSEEYTLTTRANDGVRVWIDGLPVIDAWTVRGVVEDRARVNLRAGQAHEVKVEFFFQDGGGTMGLSWESASQPKEPVPATAFSTFDGLPGIVAEHYRESDLGELISRRVESIVAWRVPVVPDFPEFRHVGTIPLQLAAPAGNYAVEWIEPATLRPLLREERQHAGGNLELTAPPFADDLLLSLKTL